MEYTKTAAESKGGSFGTVQSGKRLKHLALTVLGKSFTRAVATEMVSSNQITRSLHTPPSFNPLKLLAQLQYLVSISQNSLVVGLPDLLVRLDKPDLHSPCGHCTSQREPS